MLCLLPSDSQSTLRGGKLFLGLRQGISVKVVSSQKPFTFKGTYIFLSLSFLVFETGYHYVAQAGLELTM